MCVDTIGTERVNSTLTCKRMVERCTPWTCCSCCNNSSVKCSPAVGAATEPEGC